MLQIAPETTLSLGVVNFLNTVPLIAGLENLDGLTLVPHVPSELIGCVEREEVDFALASSIDYQQSNFDLKMLPTCVLSSEGNVLTVRVCSKVPFEEVKNMYCDSDSHTSIALMQIIMKQLYGLSPQVIPTEIRSLNDDLESWPETILIIGDKVVASKSHHFYPHVLDLGEAWKNQTGLPFVFAAWFGKANTIQNKISLAVILLERQLKCNLHRIEQVVSNHAPQRGWDEQIAKNYLTQNMEYHCSDEHIQSLELFYKFASDIGVISTIKHLEIFE